jgi:hypothetical protein|eukprot:scaffold1201_cov199-Alexandrium_tamarense.AAC.2
MNMLHAFVLFLAVASGTVCEGFVLEVRFVHRRPSNFRYLQNQSNSSEGTEPKSAIEMEIEDLQQKLHYIEALEERNKSQLQSFIDEEDQWNALEEDERELLLSKKDIEKKMEVLVEQMVMLWMGQKSQEG